MKTKLKNLNIVRAIYSKIPENVDLGQSTYKKYRNLIREYEFQSQRKIKEFQFYQLQKLVNYCWKNIDGYREYWTDNNFKPQMLKELSDIELIPLIEKDIIKNNLDKFSNTSLKSIRLENTGGSTGNTFSFYTQGSNKTIELAFNHDLWSRKYPLSSKHTKSVFLRGEKLKDIYKRDPLTGLYLSSYHINKENVIKYIKLIEKNKFPVFQAYPSTIYLMAKIMKMYNLHLNHRFATIILTSEPVYDFQKNLIKEVFDTNLSFTYGSSEKVVYAGNCEFDDKYHVYPLYGFTEIIDNKGKQVNKGEQGEIIGTSFWNYATPLIRYKTNDIAELGENYCSKCQRHNQILNKIEGRIQDYIVDKERCLVTLTALIFAQHFNAFKHINNLNITQEKEGEITLNIVPENNFDKNDQNELINKILSVSDNKIKPEIHIVENLERTEKGKTTFLKQKLDIKQYIH